MYGSVVFKGSGVWGQIGDILQGLRMRLGNAGFEEGFRVLEGRPNPDPSPSTH